MEHRVEQLEGQTSIFDVLTDTRTLACGCLDLGPVEHGGRIFQCVHEWEAYLVSRERNE